MKIIEWIIFVLLLCIVFVVISPLLPTKQYISSYVVSTGSMEPSIKTGSVVFSSNQDSFNEGDIIVFESPDNKENTIVHRIVSIEDDKYITKGDNNTENDSWLVNESQIKGKVVCIVPYLGYAVEWMKTPIGFAVVLGIPALVIMVLQVRKVKEGINEEVEKRVSERV